MNSVTIVKHGVAVRLTNFIYTRSGDRQLGIYPGMEREFANALLETVPKDIYGFAQLGEVDPHLIKRMNEFEYWLGYLPDYFEQSDGKQLTLYRAWTV